MFGDLVRPPRSLVAAVAILATLSFWVAGHAQEGATTDSSHIVPLFSAANDTVRQGFVRLVNDSDEAGEVEVRAFDDAGEEYGPVTLAIEAGEVVHFNSNDLETGNPAKGLTGATGVSRAPAGQRRWRLVFESDLKIRVMGYARTADGFLTSMHDVVTERATQDGYTYEVALFNPASNTNQVSVLRVVNRSDAEAAVTITGLDDAGEAGDEAVKLTVPAGAARMLGAPALESGGGDLEGALGDGTGKWRLTLASDRPLAVMSLLQSLTGHLTNLSSAPAGAGADGVHRLWLLPPASAARQGFVRLINESDKAGTVRVRAFDDTGNEYGPVTLAIEAGEVVHFNSSDLETGNPAKGLTGATGVSRAPAGQRRWRLAFESDLKIRAMGYVHTADGFLTSMHDVVAKRATQDGYTYEVAFFNPASNTNQVSVLRVVNRSDAEAAVTITGLDDAGEAGDEAVKLTAPAGAARMLGAPALESGGEDLEGALGDGRGKWRLTLVSDRPLAVMSLLASPTGHLTNLSTAPAQVKGDPFARWNELEPQSWWRESAPYSCAEQEKQTSVWLDAGLADLGGADSLSLIRYFGNGSYLRYGHMGFYGCTRLRKYPDSYHLDPPADPTYYSLGDLEIRVDIARVPAEASGWLEDDGTRIDLSMADTVALLNEYVAAYFRRVSQDRLRITFHAGNEFTVPGDGSPSDANDEQLRLIGACLDGCEHGAPGGLNRILLNDVAADTAGRAYNGWAGFGLASVRDGNMELIVHEMGHGWMAWPHSYAEVGWRAEPGDDVEPPNPYSNFFDIMSQLDLLSIQGWDHDMPSTLAINRYAAGWIPPEDVAVHLNSDATYTLSAPREPGHQFLVIHSGRRHAFTTLEVLEQRPERFRVQRADVYDPEVTGDRRARRYDGVLVSRYDQSAGTGAEARFGPALYRRDNPDYLADVGWGRDDYSLVSDGETRDIGGGVRVAVEKNAKGGWDVTVSGGVVAEFERWCAPFWFSGTEYDTGCLMDEAEWE